MKIDITKFTNFLTESYVNLFDADKRKWDYLDQVWDMLQESYRRMNGFHSVKTKEDLVTECKMWKLSKKNGKVIAGIIYKDRNGRKSVWIFSDGTSEGKRELFKFYTEDLTKKRAFKEVSKPILDWLEKYGFPVKDYLVPATVAKDIVADPTFKFTSDEFAYKRKIQDKEYEKYLLGDTEKCKNKDYGFDLF